MDVGYTLGGRRPGRQPPAELEATPGLVVEVNGEAFVGAVVEARADRVVLEDRHGRRRGFTLHPGGFRHEGRPATLLPPRAAPDRPALTRSGSLAVARDRARIATASRIWVEGIHDAELIEHLWGDDLRWVGVVVEPLHGADDLVADVRTFAPSPTRRLGILLDHLVAGSKERRLADAVRHPDVLVVGHPFVDIWAAVDPRLAGLPAWPTIPRGRSWKAGVCAHLGVDEPGRLWRQLLAAVGSVTDVHRDLRQAVERLIDFVTVPEDAEPDAVA